MAERRERKKAVTRAAILDAALELFLERGFDDVSVREIADKADVSPTTVFAHFAQKEALLFYEEDDQRARLVAAVRDRTAGTTISRALSNHYRAEFAAMWSGDDGQVRGRVMDLMQQTPALQQYAERMWFRHEDALAAAIAAELQLAEPSDEVRLYARFALQIQLLASGDTDPLIDAGFALLEPGWARYLESLPSP